MHLTFAFKCDIVSKTPPPLTLSYLSKREILKGEVLNCDTKKTLKAMNYAIQTT